ncbi:hypothetical protein QEN19_003222 [Hanseniaspora menglaensis]
MLERTKLIGLHLLQVLAIGLFCIGYFPRKPILNDISFKTDDEQTPKIFNKLVIVMIDALRTDFLYYKENSQFGNIHQLINDGKGIGFTAFANPPTVTLPRLKGILTGSTPIFLDAILNVAEGDDSSNLKDHDSILKQFALNNKKINFYGDDTWLKLFGDKMFNECEGTSSFFVKDFTDVDNNVTRHIQPNLNKKDEWDILILHYLGLDHIGHAMGSSNPEMVLKQKELDSIVKELYDSLDDDSLLLVLGDHGMTDSGNHGGSSSSETNAAMCFLSKKFHFNQKGKEKLPLTVKNDDYEYLTKIQQVDLVPTLMSFFNLPIPKNNVGVLIENLIDPFFSEQDKTKLINHNTRQLYDLLDIHDEISRANSNISKMKELQQQLMESSTNYNYPVLYISIALMGLLFLLNLFLSFEFNIEFAITVTLSLILGISSFATSFIEEEHKVWYWLLIFIIIAFNFVLKKIEINSSLNTLGLLFTIRLLKSWNNSGQKFFYYDLIGNYLQKYELICWTLNLISILFLSTMYKSDSNFIVTIQALLGMILFVYKINWEMKNSSLNWSFLKKYNLIFDNEQLVNVARTIFKASTIMLMANKFMKPVNKTLQLAMITLILMMQSSIVNIPMFMCFMIIEMFIDNLNLNTKKAIILEMLLEYLSFFSFGNTNSISTIDLINAYNGVSASYDLRIVGFLMLSSTFAPSIFFSLKQSSRNYTLTLKYSLMLNSLWGFLFLLSCFIGKYHLFVWSVFSPKLCYFLAWNFFMNVVVKVVFPLILF